MRKMRAAMKWRLKMLRSCGRKVITYLAVRKEICDVGYYPVLRELQNSAHDTSQAIFDMASAMRFEKTRDGFLRADKRLIRWQEMAGATVFLDWAGGRDIAENALCRGHFGDLGAVTREPCRIRRIH